MAGKSEVQKTGMFSNILAVAGLVILIAIIFWGLFHLVALSKSWISSLAARFSSSAQTIQVTVPANKIPSGEQFLVSWKYTPKSAGAYAFLYQCREGFQFKTTIVSGVQTAIPCGTGYTIPSSNNEFSVTPILAGTSSLDIPLSIIFIPSAPANANGSASRAEGNASVTVTSAPSAAAIPPAEISAPKSQAVETPAPAPKLDSPDLSVRILSQGVIDPMSGNIIARPPTSPNDLVAVRFLISNVGSASTGTWYFGAQLPMSPAYPYASPAQVPLAPGDSIENTLRFTHAIPGGIFSVSVDPSNQVKESNEGNNTASTAI